MKKFRLPSRRIPLPFSKFLEHVRSNTPDLVLENKKIQPEGIHFPTDEKMIIGRLPNKPWKIRALMRIGPMTLISILLYLVFIRSNNSAILITLATFLALVALLQARALHNLEQRTRAWVVGQNNIVLFEDALASRPPTVLPTNEIEQVIEVKSFDRRNRPEAFSDFILVASGQEFLLESLPAVNFDRDAEFLRKTQN